LAVTEMSMQTLCSSRILVKLVYLKETSTFGSAATHLNLRSSTTVESRGKMG
jgi:hypothetical protein